MEDETVAPLVLSVFTFLGKYKPIGKYNAFFTGFFGKSNKDAVFLNTIILGNGNATSIFVPLSVFVQMFQRLLHFTCRSWNRNFL